MTSDAERLRVSDRRLRIGTAGWSIPRAASEYFPEMGSHLQRYAAVLSAAEINSSFHRPHRRGTYERWANAVPPDFRFCVKIPKTITHDARLVGCEPLIGQFVEQASGLGEKLDIVLLQLPPSLVYEEGVMDYFHVNLRRALPAGVDIVCEPRHASWFEHDVDRWLADRKIARVAADPALVPGAEQPEGWKHLHYHRLHGSPRVYYSSYDLPKIRALADALTAGHSVGKRSWCIFDNTASSAATTNALELQAAVNGDRIAKPAEAS